MRYLHLIWLQGINKIPLKYTENIEKWKKFAAEYSWEIKFWDQDEILKLIPKSHYTIYLNYPVIVQKADIGRYYILKNYGGLYLDLDTYPEDMMQFNKFLESVSDNKVVMPENDVAYLGFPPFDGKVRTWMIYTKNPQHLLFDRLIEASKLVHKRRKYQIRSYYVAKSTGSVLVTKNMKHDVETVNLKKLIDTSYESDWGGIHYLDSQDKLIIGIIVFLLIVLLILIVMGYRYWKKRYSR